MTEKANGKAKRDDDKVESVTENKVKSNVEGVEAKMVESIENTREDEMKDEEQGEMLEPLIGTDKHGYRRFRDVSNHELEEAVSIANSFHELKALLSLNPKYNHYEHIKSRCDKNNIDWHHLLDGRIAERYSKEELIIIASECKSYAEVASKIGNTRKQVEKVFKQFGIDVDRPRHTFCPPTNNSRSTNRTGYIYKIENISNGKIYIGQTINLPEKRWKEHISSAYNKNGTGYDYPLYQAFRKYGVENFSFDIIEKCQESELNEKERYYIKIYDSYKHGYNQTLGGGGYPQVGDQDEIKIVALYQAGQYISDISHSLGYETSTIRNVLERRGVDSDYLCKENRRRTRHKIWQYALSGELIRTFESLSEAGDWLIENGYSKCQNRSAAATQIKMRLAQGNHEYAGYYWDSDFTKEQLDDFLRKNVLYKQRMKSKPVKERNRHSYDDCPQCGKPKDKKSKLCQSCRNKKLHEDYSRLPVAKDELKALIRQHSFRSIANSFGVTDNTVRKWCKRYSLPYRSVDIKNMSDQEWNDMDVFLEDDKLPCKKYDYQQAIALFEKVYSWKYVCSVLDISTTSIADIRSKGQIKQRPIEWSSTSCHIIGTELYFRTVTDAGHWLAETKIEMQKVHEHKRGKPVKEAIENQALLCGYQFEYIPEEDYFDIIESHEVISYAYQEHREVPPQVKE